MDRLCVKSGNDDPSSFTEAESQHDLRDIDRIATPLVREHARKCEYVW